MTLRGRAVWAGFGGLLLIGVLGCGGDPVPVEEPPPGGTAGSAKPGGPFRSIDPTISGLDFTYASGARGDYLYPESMGGGVGLCDVDGDGDLDLYLLQGGAIEEPAARGENRLFLNRGQGRFEDVTEAAGAGHDGYAMGVACADVDDDGDVDLYVTNLGPDLFLRNLGDGRFEDATVEAGLGDPSWGAGAVFADFDGDDRLDLYVTNYLHWTRSVERDCHDDQGGRDYCGPSQYRSPARDSLYLNRGDGGFEDVSVPAGLGTAFGNGLGVTAEDFDRDGDVDVYVANDQTANQLWMNRGDGTFVDEALLAGAALSGLGAAEAGMGVAVADLDRDGWSELFLTHLAGQTNTLYANRGGLFDDVTASWGLAAPSLTVTGFGVGFFDFDQDGRLDLFVANGRVKRELPVLVTDDPFAEPDHLYRGRETAFVPWSLSQPGREIATSRAAAFGDLDGDLDIDVVVVNRDRPVVFLENAGASGGALQVAVRRASGAHEIGARIRVVAGESVHHRVVRPGFSYLASNDPLVHVGLGSDLEVERLEVDRSGRRSVRLLGVPAGRTIVVGAR